jgi:serine/threonine protein kinase/Leucine-rich repeat (LRR) protein
MALDDRLSDLLVDWEQGQRDGREPTLEELCKDAPELLPIVRESIDSLKATRWMFEPDSGATSDDQSTGGSRAALHDTELPASHLTVEQFAASIFQSGLLSPAEIDELNQRLTASDLPGEAREIASRLVTEGKLTRYQASVLLKASKDPLLIDNYVILDTLDTGGMGLVFKALHRSMNRVVALKLLPAAMMSARDTVKRFQREVHAAAALSHPNIVAAYDAHQSEEIAYLVLEYVEGTNLFRLVKERGPLPVALAANYARQAATGLAYLHSRGIIHRDVKPANLILADDGTVKLLDMGLVRFASAEDLSCAEMDQELTQAGIVIGTVAYMSPEQALDTRSADQRSDIYSLGCTLFFLLTSRSLYHEETGMKTLLAHREQPVPTIRQFCEEAPVSLDAVFRTMVAKRPADRLQSMSEVVAALDACVPGLGSHSPPSMPPRRVASGARPVAATLSRRWTRLRSSPLRIAIAFAILAGSGAGGTYLAGILIQIRTKHGTTEVRVDDPDAEVTVKKDGDNSKDFQSLIHGSKKRDLPSAGTTAPAYREEAPSDTEQSPTYFEPKRSDIQAGPAKTQELQALNEHQRAEAAKLWESVHSRNQKSSTDAVAATCQKIIDNYPNTEFAARAREELAKLKRAEKQPGDQVLADDTPRPLPTADLDRKLAEWVLKLHGEIVTNAGQIDSLKVLPTSPLDVNTIKFDGNELIDDFSLGELQRFHPLHLRELHLEKTHITDGGIPALNVLPRLRVVDLADTRLTDAGVKQLSTIAQLQEIDLSRTRITDRALEFLASLPNLINLSLDQTQLNGDGLVHRLPVQNLSLSGTPITDAALARLERWPWLRKLDLTSTHVTTSGIAKLQGALPKCSIAHDKWNVAEAATQPNLRETAKKMGRLPGERQGFREPPSADTKESVDRQVAKWVLSRPANLIWLGGSPARMSRSIEELPHGDFRIQGITVQSPPIKPIRVSDTDIERLGSLSELQWLNFPVAAITDREVRLFANLTNLTRLSLATTKITDACLPALARMKRLSSLDLSGTAITDTGLEQLAKMKSLDDPSLVAEDQRKSSDPRMDPRRYPLPSLILDNTKTTEAGLLKLQQALPNCAIFAWHIYPGPNGPNHLPLPPKVGSTDREWARWLLGRGSLQCRLFADVDPETGVVKSGDLPPIPFHIQKLSFQGPFRELSASDLNSFLFRRLAELSALREIKIAQPVPAVAFRGLGALKSLQKLSIDADDAGDDSFLQAVSSVGGLKSLRFAGEKITDAGVRHLASLKELTLLDLSGHARDLHGSGFEALRGLTNLRALDVTGCGLDDEGARGIEVLTSLESLSVRDTWISGKGLAALAGLKHLKFLNLAHCRRLRTDDLAPLSELSSLEQLDLSNCRLTAASSKTLLDTLKKLKNLRTLNLMGTGVPPGHVAPGLPQLKVTEEQPLPIPSMR